MTGLTDSHCHLSSEALRDRADDVIARARAAGVAVMITIATDVADAEQALAISARHEGVHVAAGIHPHQAGEAAPGWEAALSKFAAREDVYAVGEMGLDFHYDFAPRARQSDVFLGQLEIAARASKPVIIHCREAHDDVLAILARGPCPPRVVFHCFTGTQREAEEILERGYWISLTGVVTFKKSDALRAVARMLPADRFMIETDAPYLAPEPVRGARPNEPAHLSYIAECIARERGLTAAALAELTASNAARFFGLSGVVSRTKTAAT